jgi:hypothetical protein
MLCESSNHSMTRYVRLPTVWPSFLAVTVVVTWSPTAARAALTSIPFSTSTATFGGPIHPRTSTHNLFHAVIY